MFRKIGLALALLAAVVGLGGFGESRAAGALAIGKCGAYGYAYDYQYLHLASAAARRKCGSNCTLVPIQRACGALAVDMKNPCGAYGYAVAPKISSAQNTAMRQCFRHGGKECVIRTWACDAKG
ncbi:MAG: DUF4189 domain-containing protein [Xanthobacteraceae bacterium]|nr:MAG: DUF4189 domain-containing protein [Xanthobacteraceae bacterium]